MCNGTLGVNDKIAGEFMRSEIFKAAKIHTAFFCPMIPCGFVSEYERFGRT
jgi:hypothetical protein